MQEDRDDSEELNNELKSTSSEEDELSGGKSDEPIKPENDVFETLKVQLENKSKQCDEYFSVLQRTAAEFDNYKKRTTKEKDSLYTDAVSDVISTFLPVVDSLKRAIDACNGESGKEPLKEGIELVNKQMADAMKNLGIEEIMSIGENFDPQLHNAVMHIEDDSYSQNVIIEEFQKGYVFKSKVIRHSMVKVAN